MAHRNWHRQYLGALLTARQDRLAKFETLEFFQSIVHEPPNGVQELLLHRTIARLRRVADAVDLIELTHESSWASYAPRVLARIADTEAVLRDYPHLAETFKDLRAAKDHAPYSLKDWRLIGDGTKLQYAGAPYWTGQITNIQEVLPDVNLKRLTIDDVVTVLDYLFRAQHRLYQVGIVTLSGREEVWAAALHRLLAVPYISMVEPSARPEDVLTRQALTAYWAPHWHLSIGKSGTTNWQITEHHTNQDLQGLGITEVFDVISVLLALSGLLRDGISLSPFDPELVRPLKPSQPVWGFQPRQYSAAGTSYQADDIRALALGFLEPLPETRRVSMFRSRLAIYFVSRAWKIRSSASMVTAENGFYQDVIEAAKLLDQNRFSNTLSHIEISSYQLEPALQLLQREAMAALELFDIVESLPTNASPSPVRHPDKILCVTHASVPEQTGGYAIRAQGVLSTLRARGVDITAVTRPGFPDGVLTESTSVEVDGVEYLRLPDTGLQREHGEIQYMMSFVRPFKELFAKTGVGVIHVRSTFLIALPALIAARQLGLKVLYEVSGLWELVYQDREKASHLLKRAPFAELAETLTMKHVDHVVVMNEAVRQIAIDRGVASEQISVAPNAVDTEDFTPLEPPNNDVFTIGYLGSFQDYEGLDDIVDAVKFLQAQGTQVRVLMVGDGFRFNPLRSHIANAGLEDYFELPGRVPHDEVIDYYRQMDILVYPRRSTGATESITPLKPFEALALAKPIIVSSVKPLREIVGDDEQRGLIFESGNAWDFAQVILKLSEDAELRSALGKAGRQWAVAHRNWDNVVEIFMNAYEQLR